MFIFENKVTVGGMQLDRHFAEFSTAMECLGRMMIYLVSIGVSIFLGNFLL
jgi:hypothetical protein